MNKRIKKKKQTTINDSRIKHLDEYLEDCRNLFGDNVTNESPYQIMMDHSKERAEFRKKHPELEYMFKAWDREREFMDKVSIPSELIKVMSAATLMLFPMEVDNEN